MKHPLNITSEIAELKTVLLHGVSARTSAQGIEKLARELFSRQASIKKVVAVEIPKIRAFMHLDTVFTMIDYDNFTYHPAIEDSNGSMKIYILEQEDQSDQLLITEKNSLAETLKEVLNLDELVLIPCGGGKREVIPLSLISKGIVHFSKSGSFNELPQYKYTNAF